MQPVAPLPEDGDHGCRSGSVVPTADGSAIVVYTSVGAGDPGIGGRRTTAVRGPRGGDRRRVGRDAGDLALHAGTRELVRPPR
ncbi:hypothetical protein DQ238_11610 [Geodermatophilus sp. TF02-6]|uniref:hypothetical protein n=1 Tax=Geodermatophilus sp. TF02-6 TaxID=2250575 RepID=UPI000DE89F23|nr:hypothetical protein [Geodermatophilus sp. TF02-6]RBY78712.1 hypothetical protein DQ238_11610 [Geodermatophilus sp. TF02-6]